jgi:outer membrane protein OmpA-like peptidoglycan-associated protein
MMIQRKHRRWRRSLGMLPVIDFILILGILIFGAITVMAQALRTMVPVAEYVNAHIDRLHTHLTELSHLVRGGDDASICLDEIRDSIPPSIPEDLGVIRRLVGAGEASVGIRSAMEEITRVDQALWTRALREVADSEQDFWSRRGNELCDGVPPMAPNLGERPNRAELAVNLIELTDYRDRIWQRYEGCREPRTVVIDEELLHFQVDKADEFESDPRPALRTIMWLVDENIASHPRIYVLGHTDERASERYNDHLSFRRALFVSDQIRKHLRSRQLAEGRDYTVYPVGRGEFQPVERLRRETDQEFWRRCRRIELSFRSAVVGHDSKGARS